ncbi:hypothetical protein BCR33DRAFT_723186 [Rhizoclosmatium globosum]|uniref:Heterokaryon incompatibility domain-containing protein n=1 Tax=Rhizoclosmatium globosum TaxID=329046 RepID=A0A1Y2BFM2_9FUNG|nr:hypothetical protein BCR33DRAFT_723186 [Rhizoclosmatium globosum]|eukprot:ORY33621.1 hypothetical protein BCR33DRAFT_723186 [Rhizoclosmatium globosum]
MLSKLISAIKREPAPVTIIDADEEMDYQPKLGPPSWLINEPSQTSRSSSAQLELWPVSKIATEFASDGILSHVWGFDLKVVEIEGVDVLLRQDDPTKLELMRHIIRSGSNGSPRIWVDILDIDQTHNDVKLTQIEQLPNLYKSKKHTIIYHSEDPISLASGLTGATNRKLYIEVLDGMLQNCEHSSRVWTLQEFVLAHKVVHVFRTDDPTMVLVAHEQFKEVFNKLPAYERNGLATWFLREGDSSFSVPWNSPAEIVERVPPIRYCSKIHDYVNGRASIYGITPISYDASTKELFEKLLEFDGLMHLSGDFLTTDDGKKSIVPSNESEMQRFLLRSFQTVSERIISFQDKREGRIKELLLATIWLPYLRNGKFNSVDSRFVETNQGWAFQVPARIIRPDQEFLISMQYLGTAKVEWWKPENQEQRVFLYNHKLCGFESDGSLVDFPWKKTPFVVPYVAVIGTTVFLVKSISDSEVILGSAAGHYYGYSKGTTHQDAVKPKPYFERNVMLYF